MKSGLLISLALIIASPTAAKNGASATLTRAALFVAKPEATIAFYTNVLGYEKDDTAKNVVGPILTTTLAVFRKGPA